MDRSRPGVDDDGSSTKPKFPPGGSYLSKDQVELLLMATGVLVAILQLLSMLGLF